MKSAAKIFIIIGICVGFWAIVPLVVGIIALKRLESAKKSSDLVTIGILTLLFCTRIGGILLLCMREDDLLTFEERRAKEKEENKDSNLII